MRWSAVVLTTASPVAALAGSFELPWFTIDGGGAMHASGGEFELSGTIGQPDADPDATAMTGGDFELTGGFWAGAAAGSDAAAAGDFDADGDVDLSDFATFGQCYGGPLNPPAASCPSGVDADFDGDGDVDLADFAVFGQNFTGPL